MVARRRRHNLLPLTEWNRSCCIFFILNKPNLNCLTIGKELSLCTWKEKCIHTLSSVLTWVRLFLFRFALSRTWTLSLSLSFRLVAKCRLTVAFRCRPVWCFDWHRSPPIRSFGKRSKKVMWAACIAHITSHSHDLESSSLQCDVIFKSVILWGKLEKKD